jgi:hypothetical protein
MHRDFVVFTHKPGKSTVTGAEVLGAGAGGMRQIKEVLKVDQQKPKKKSRQKSRPWAGQKVQH